MQKPAYKRGCASVSITLRLDFDIASALSVCLPVTAPLHRLLYSDSIRSEIFSISVPDPRWPQDLLLVAKLLEVRKAFSTFSSHFDFASSTFFDRVVVFSMVLIHFFASVYKHIFALKWIGKMET
jgi:hypothetical protein